LLAVKPLKVSNNFVVYNCGSCRKHISQPSLFTQLYLGDRRERVQPVILNDNHTVLLMATQNPNQINKNNNKRQKEKMYQECTNSKHVVRRHFKRCFYTYIYTTTTIYKNIYICK